MSTGFLVKFINCTALTITDISAKAGSEGDWEDASASPDIIKGSIQPASSSVNFHLERHNFRRSCPFTVILSLSDNEKITFTLDGENAINATHNGRIPSNDSTGKMGIFELIVPADQIPNNSNYPWNGMTIFITKDVWTK
ncbi:MAG: hypothetical protein V4732_10625 [Pseudomonadota bacterium]